MPLDQQTQALIDAMKPPGMVLDFEKMSAPDARKAMEADGGRHPRCRGTGCQGRRPLHPRTRRANSGADLRSGRPWAVAGPGFLSWRWMGLGTSTATMRCAARSPMRPAVWWCRSITASRPKRSFPAAAEDCYAATLWVAENAAALGCDPKRLAVGGDSAGGNLAAVVPLMARDRGKPPIAYQVLMYPVTDGSLETGSMRELADGYFLTHGAMVWFWNHYVRDSKDRSHPYAAPITCR